MTEETDESYCLITFCPRKGPDYSNDPENPMPLCTLHADQLGLQRKHK